MGASQLSFYLIKELNKFSETNPQTDTIVFYEDIQKNYIPPNFAIMNMSESWGQSGPTIATSISTAKKMLHYPSKEKFFYVWDLEWIRNRHPYEKYSKIYADETFKIIARSEGHKRLIENAFNRKVEHVVPDFNMSSIMEVVK